MHEQSIVRAILKQVDQIRRQHRAVSVTGVRVEVGPLSCVEPTLLATAFARTVQENAAVSPELVVDEVSLLARCLECDHEFDVEGFVFKCPECQGRVEVLRGDQIQLVSVTVC